LCNIGTERWALIPACLRRRKDAQLSAAVLAAALYAVALAGCAPNSTEHGPTVVFATANTDIRPALRRPIPLPARALLEAQPEPNCDFQVIGLGDTLLDTNGAALAKQGYERQCYQQAETIVRTRLRLLQVAVGETIKAVKRSEQK
jgi:hypothetical protein